jgi:hypothetical protein
MESSNEREVAVSFACVIDTPQSDLRDIFFSNRLKKKVDPDLTEFGLMSSEYGSMDDFATLRLEPNGHAAAEELLKAKPGNDLNLSRKEIDAFRRHAATSGDKANKNLLLGKVEETLRHNLLDRYRSYREKGLQGIPPYARGKNKNFDPADDIMTSTRFAKILQREVPNFFQYLVDGPSKQPQGLEESFSWVNYPQDNMPTVALMHRMGVMENGVYVFAERHYYSSRGINSMQGIGGAFPCKNGTGILFVVRSSTDLVSGFGAAAKRNIGSRIMGSLMAKQLDRFRSLAERNELS